MIRFLTFLIRLYQKFKILLFIPDTCRFHPSCSNYILQALKKYGPWKGSYLGLRRIGRCSPLSAGGYDPVK